MFARQELYPSCMPVSLAKFSVISYSSPRKLIACVRRCLRQGLSLHLELTSSARLSGQQTSGMCHVLPPHPDFVGVEYLSWSLHASEASTLPTVLLQHHPTFILKQGLSMQAQAGPSFSSLLPQPFKCWDDRGVPINPAFFTPSNVDLRDSG